MGPQSAGLIITLGFGTGGSAPAPAPETATETPAGRRTRRRRIILRIDGRLQEVDSLDQVLDVLKAVKKDMPATARAAAQQLVGTGKRIGDAKKEQQHAIEVVEAPYSIKDMVETRLAEVQRLFWKRVAAYMREIDRDDEDVMAVL